jgi:hypothetical protein
MAFRKKNKTRELVVPKLTLDSLHKNMSQKFVDQHKSIIELKQDLTVLSNKIKELKSSKEFQNPIPNIKLQTEVWSLEEQYKSIETEIKKIESKTYEKEYLIKTGKILNQYYKLLDKEKEITEETSKRDFLANNIEQSNEKNTIVDLLDAPINSHKIITDCNDSNTSSISQQKKQANRKLKKKDILDYLGINHGEHGDDSELDKQKLYNQYMKIIDPTFVPQYEDELELFDICTHCHSEMLLNHNSGMLNCKSCGNIEKIIVDSDKQSHKEPPKEMTSFSYKRINHLNEILSQFQAKETTEIPSHVYEKIEIELKKARITDMTLLTKEKLREILKKIDETDYYEHIPYIINQLNGLPPPVISAEVEEIIRGLFLQAQPPFNTYCPDDRKNFLTYGYTLYKLFELLELDEYLDNFKFLKDRSKLYDQEQIWKKICNELKWEFIPTV